ncbi:MAG: O-antigen ligase family protein [Pseudomonadota bacterium]
MSSSTEINRAPGVVIDLRRAALFFACVMIAGAALLDFVPRPSSPASLIFVAALGALLSIRFVHVALTQRMAFRWLDVFALVIVAVTGVSVLPALTNGVSTVDWARGAVPFVFYGVIVLLNGLDDEYSLVWLTRAMLIGCALWVVKIIAQTASAIPAVLSGDLSRLTLVTLDLTVPLAMIGFTLVLFLRQLRPLLRIGALGTFLVLIFLAGYRSQLLLIFGVLLVYFSRLSGLHRLRLVFAGLVAAMALLSTGGLDPVFDSIGRRFASVGEEVESVRGRELSYALSNFSESPLVGKGLSFPVPVAITRGDDAWNNYDSDTVRYIHSFPGYVLMDMGLLGVVAFGAFWVTAVFSGWHARSASVVGEAAFWSLITVLAFFLISAAFRQIQTTVFSMVLVHIISSCRRTPNVSPAPDA